MPRRSVGVVTPDGTKPDVGAGLTVALYRRELRVAGSAMGTALDNPEYENNKRSDYDSEPEHSDSQAAALRPKTREQRVVNG